MYLELRGRKLHSEEPCDLYSSPNIRVMKSRHVRWADHVACMAGKGNTCRSLCEKPEGKKPFRRPAWWEDHITMGFKEIGWESVDWIHLAQFKGQGHSCEDWKVLLASRVGL
jgi:hypothetical protein